MNSNNTPPHESRAATTLQPIAPIEEQQSASLRAAKRYASSNRGAVDLFDIGLA